MRFLSTLLASTLGTLLALGLTVFVFFLFVFAVALSSDGTPSVADGSVLVMELDGPIPEVAADDPFAEAFGGRPSYDLRDVTLALRKAAADERVEAVWLQTKGVSASWATLQEIRTALADYRESGKLLFASSDDYAMNEASYYLASAADSVFAAPQAIFEFNGFATTLAFFQGTLERLEVEPQIIRAGKYKSAVEPFIRDDLSPENEEQLTALLNGVNTHFMQAVSESRGLSAESLRSTASDAALLTAEGARAAGLLDGLLFRDEVADLLRERLGGYEPEDDLRSIDLGDYARVPASEAGLETGSDGKVAVVYAQGQIVSGESETPLFGNSPASLGAETFGEAMREARDDEDVSAVVVRINSPGGSASASDAMWRAIELTADEKPVIVSMGDVAASGGYWMATAADTIMADPLTITGSIGVFGLLFDASGFFNDKLGVTFDGVRTSPYADLFSGLRPLSEPERRLFEDFVDDTYQAFLEKVAASQGLTTAEVDSLAQGRVWSGEDALRVGLVDTLGTLGDAIALAARQAGLEDGTYRTLVLPRPKTVFEQLAESMNARATRLWMRWRTTPVERAFLEQRRALEQLVREHGTAQARLPMEITIE